MSITDSHARVLLSLIDIERDARQRRAVVTDGLKESIAKNGVLSPIIVQPIAEGRYLLIAGERRLQASQELNLPDIICRMAEELSPIEAQIIELEENAKRMDLDWDDCCRAVGRIHQLHLELDEEWTQGETADACALSSGAVSMYLKVYYQLELGDERIEEAGTIREAYNILTRRDSRAAGEALQEILETTQELGQRASPKQAPEVESADELAGSGNVVNITGGALTASLSSPLRPKPRVVIPAEQSILHESFLNWAPLYKGKKFNLLHCDFPYGVNLFNGPQGGGGRHESAYQDSPDVYWDLLTCLCENLDRLLAVSAHLMFWYSAKHHDQTMQIFREKAPSLVFQPFPLIWVKSDNAGIASDVRRNPRHVYETCLMASRGARQIVRVAADVYSAPTDKRFHVSTKPEPMLKHFMSMMVDGTTSMLDPTCGSASSLRAAEELGASSVLGMDIDEQNVGVARVALRNSRLMRTANKELV